MVKRWQSTCKAWALDALAFAKNEWDYFLNTTFDKQLTRALNNVFGPKAAETYTTILTGAVIGNALNNVSVSLDSAKATAATSYLDDTAGKVPTLGSKLDYFLGKATGNTHNIEHSQEMLRQLESVGLPDTAATRKLLTKDLTSTLNNTSSILETQANGRIVRESLLMRPRGGLKFQTVGEGDKLITGTLFGGK